jgi:hypothetical protein
LLQSAGCFLLGQGLRGLLLRASRILAVAFFWATGTFWATLIASTALATLTTFTTLGGRT